MTIPAPPVPARLRELLADYPAHLEKLQHAITKAADEPRPIAAHIEMVIWAIEDTMEAFVAEARSEVRSAKEGDDAEKVALAEEAESLMRRARFKHVWIGDAGLTDYVKRTRGGRA